jgi:hypothetical protein
VKNEIIHYAYSVHFYFSWGGKAKFCCGSFPVETADYSIILNDPLFICVMLMNFFAWRPVDLCLHYRFVL